MSARDALTDARSRITKNLIATAYIVGAQTMPDEIVEIMVDDLSKYPTEWVLGALTRCRSEVKTQRLTPSDITSRFDDGRPGPEQAWAAVSVIDSNSDGSIVWTKEMSTAWGVARFQIDAGELVSARMAFIEVYKQLVLEARERGTAATWHVMPGSSNAMEAVIPDAVRLGRITREYAAMMLGHLAPEELDGLLTDQTKSVPRLVHDGEAIVQQLALNLARKKIQ